MDEFSRQELLVGQFTVTEFTAQIQALQDKVKSMNDPRISRCRISLQLEIDYPTFLVNL